MFDNKKLEEIENKEVGKIQKNKKLTIEEMKKIAMERGGLCLSDTYINNATCLEWECKRGHRWQAKPTKIKQGHWCPVCGRKRVIQLAKKTALGIEKMQKIAHERGGSCLSKVYLNANRHLMWQCADGHTWLATPSKIKNAGQWCPYCNRYINQEKCRYIFEKLLGYSFPQDRRILDGLELDGYNEQLKLGFEYNGAQHYEYIPFFHENENALRQQQEVDEKKVLLSQERGITLIIIPYHEINEVDGKTLVENIYQKLQVLNIPIIGDIADFNFEGFYPGLSRLKRLRKIATQREGRCLSNQYIDRNVPMKWQCKEGHIWETSAFNIQYGSWCPHCVANVKLTIEQMQELAQNHEGRCLSDMYINNETPLTWECSQKHTWQAIPTSVKSGKWCPYCSRRKKLTIEEMEEIAQQRGGKCLSSTYTNNEAHLAWECKLGHVWQASPNNVKHGTWCPICEKKKHVSPGIKLTIKEMHTLASNRGGRCLSQVYINNHTHLRWECHKGHQWLAQPAKVKKGCGCPICGGIVKLSIEDMQAIALERGGQCLSNTYINTDTKLDWKCAENHIWSAKASQVRQGTWCPYCAKKVKLTIEEMQDIAIARGGGCLSENYVNSKKHLRWECKRGHQWSARPDKIKRGQWCPLCANKKVVN